MRKAKKPTPRGWLGYREAARHFQTTPWAMYQAYTTGAVPSFVFRGKLYCLRSDIEKWLASLPERRMSA